LEELSKNIVLRTKVSVIDTTQLDQERYDQLSDKTEHLQQEKNLLDLEKTRMDLIIHVTEANNRRCEFWKESLQQTHDNYKLAIQEHQEMLAAHENEIRELQNLKDSYRLANNQSKLSHGDYLAGISGLKDDQGQASEMFYNSGSMIEEAGTLAKQELQEIDKASIETSLNKMAYLKKLEEENKLDLIRLGVLKTKANLFQSQTGISAYKADSNIAIEDIGDKLRRFKDAKEKLEALKIYKESLQLTLDALMKKKLISLEENQEQNSAPITSSALEELKTKESTIKNATEQKGTSWLQS
jgi:hypothetical protein